METSRNYRLTVYCNPHDSFRHYHDEEILRLDGRTPVEWIVDGCSSLTLDEAREALERIVNANDSLIYMDKENAEDLAQCIINDHGDDMSQEEIDEIRSMPWFKGEGWYESNADDLVPVYLVGEDSYRDDVLFYSIEEIEEVEQ